MNTISWILLLAFFVALIMMRRCATVYHDIDKSMAVAYLAIIIGVAFVASLFRN